MGRTLQRPHKPSLCHLRRRHRPSASSGDQRRPRTLALSARNHRARHRGTTDMVFDTVNRDGLWRIMWESGCPERFTQTSHVLCHADGRLRGERPGIVIAYKTDGHLLNHRRMHFQSRVSTNTVPELLFANDCVFNTTSEGDMQRSMGLFATACDNLCQVINPEKGAVMHQPPPDAACIAFNINVIGAQLQVVDNFTYLTITLSFPVKALLMRSIDALGEAFCSLVSSPLLHPRMDSDECNRSHLGSYRLETGQFYLAAYLPPHEIRFTKPYTATTFMVLDVIARISTSCGLSTLTVEPSVFAVD
ncbi:hypothetical protein SprV_0100283500 [Sparganum proliferum]